MFPKKISIRKHPFVILTVLILLIWVTERIWPIMQSKFFSHPQAIYVESLVIRPKASAERWQSLGTIKALQDIVVASEVTGIIADIAVQHGQIVKQGDVLLAIGHEDISASLQKAQAILAQKQLYYQRVQRLQKTHAVSQETISEALSAFQQAQADLQVINAQLNKYIIKAPFSGVVGIWQVNKGQLVTSGMPLVTLTDLSATFVDFMLPAKTLGSIAVGNKIEFTTESYPTRIWTGAVIAIDPQLDMATRSVALRAKIEHPQGLVPRLYGKVILSKPRPEELFIPQEAVIYDPQGAAVYVLNKKISELRHIELGTHEENDVMVKHGLKAGDEIVTAGMMKLFPGAEVSINKKASVNPKTEA